MKSVQHFGRNVDGTETPGEAVQRIVNDAMRRPHIAMDSDEFRAKADFSVFDKYVAAKIMPREEVLKKYGF